MILRAASLHGWRRFIFVVRRVGAARKFRLRKAAFVALTEELRETVARQNRQSSEEFSGERAESLFRFLFVGFDALEFFAGLEADGFA
ncbi:MAG: hypothetical protein WBA09_01500, partial [Candidatus Acidiferrum sp.]